MGDINNYKINKSRERGIMVACDYVGSYQTSCNQPIEDAREQFFETIIKIAKLKNHNTISFSFFSTDLIDKHQISQVTEILEKEKIKTIMKESNINIVIGGQYRKEHSDNMCKYENIIEELEELSYQYNITDVIAFDDVTSPVGKMFFINERIFRNFPGINIDYISSTNYFPYYDQYIEEGFKFNMHGEFTNDEYRNITEEKRKKLKGLGNLGYMSSGLSKMLNKLNNKKNQKEIEEK